MQTIETPKRTGPDRAIDIPATHQTKDIRVSESDRSVRALHAQTSSNTVSQAVTQPSDRTPASGERAQATITKAVQAQPNQAPASDSANVCWLAEKPSPLRADHQVELLHLQAEADALLLKLQTAQQQS